MRFPTRAAFIAVIVFIISAIPADLIDIETNLGLDRLFQLRGPLQPPAKVVVIDIDESSEDRLHLGSDLTRWRRHHAELVNQLWRQKAALIIFDLQFIIPHADEDPAFAQSLRTAGNVLLTDCVQKFRRGSEDYFGRDECSENYKTPAAAREGPSDKSGDLPEQFVTLRKISANKTLVESALDHAPFFLAISPDDPTIRQAWTFYDELAETPSLPILAWISYLYRGGDIKLATPGSPSISAWLTERRRQCRSGGAGYDSGLIASDKLKQQIVDIICRENSRYLDYYGPPRTLRMESYADVYEGKVSDLAGAAVFIGKANRVFAAGKTDFFQAPFADAAGAKISGVEIMATQFANLLEGRSIEPTPYAGLAVFFFGLFIALIAFRYAGIVGILASLAAGVAYAGLAYSLFTRLGLWLPLAGPLLIQLPLSWLLALVWSQRDLLNERKRILDFVRHVFPQWLHFLPASPGQWYPGRGDEELIAERGVHALCLATDIEGYTSLAAQHSPGTMWALLKSYYHVLGYPVTSHNGIIANIQGDEMMALWIDLPDEERRQAGCLAALDIETAVERFNQTPSAGILPTRIGLHEGEIILGSGEAGGLRFYNPFGDTVNTASRIQGVNKFLGTRILASNEVTATLTGLVCRPVGLFRVEGREEPLELVEIIDRTDDTRVKPIFLQAFADGLRLFQQGHWKAAAERFTNLLRDYGHDGPASYYLGLAITHQIQPPVEWEGVVTLSEK